MQRKHILVKGLVQGVGFRPYVFSLARQLDLGGWVTNTSLGVEIEVEGGPQAVADFLSRLPQEKPPLARVMAIDAEDRPCLGEKDFAIRKSSGGRKDTLISADTAICSDCLRELFDSSDRRYRYPFINCTNCGPRFTIIEELPYDRKATTMKAFPLCPDCEREFNDPVNRRFHAQPNACPVCGPRLSFYDNKGKAVEGDPLAVARQYLRQGKVIAVKGLGGWHLACDALNDRAVGDLRQKKYRYHKPLALMMPDLETVKKYCRVNSKEEELLLSNRRPIVILEQKKEAAELSPEVAPGYHNLGVMLPYTPLHYLLLQGWQALVMTSGNLSDEPIAYGDGEALSKLSGIAEGFLGHDRAIVRPCDDSVLRVIGGEAVFLRRSRGYAPEPLLLPRGGASILACGAEEQCNFCLTKGDKAFISQYIGDLENIATYQSFSREIEYFKQMFDIRPGLIAHDLHPEYLSTKYALADNGGLPLFPVQHHHAHLASVLAEYGRKAEEEAIGLIFDGTGLGTDGNLWGGEALIGGQKSFRRAAHLAYAPLPGGEKAIREPWRMALSYIILTFGKEKAAPIIEGTDWPKSWQTLWQAVEKKINSPQTSGMGRLFDAVSLFCGIIKDMSYHGQPAMQLEQAIDHSAQGSYRLPFLFDKAEDCLVIDWRPLFRELVSDRQNGLEAGICSLKFHNAIVDLARSLCGYLRGKYALNLVVLSGGVWQNAYLLANCLQTLRKDGFEVLTNRLVPPNDGGIALGQAAVALANIDL